MTFVRQTSIEAYKTIRDNGLLSQRRMQVYDYVFKHGPVTARDTHKGLAKSPGTNSSSFMGRFSELRDMGLFQEVGTVFDHETRQTVILWDVTDRLPIKMDKPKKIKCKHCDGRGYFVEQQTKFI